MILCGPNVAANVFSMSAARDLSLAALKADLRAPVERAKTLPFARLATSKEETQAIEMQAIEIDRVLPDGGLPRGAVVEVASHQGLGRSTTFALLACAAAQQDARLKSGNPRTTGAWCAFVDPWSTLHGPAVVEQGVDLSRLLVVRPPLDAIARVAVRIAESRAFGLLAIDTVGPPGAALASSHLYDSVRLDRWPTVVRRLAIAIERTDTSVLLLTDQSAPRTLPLPVSMRLELSVQVSQEGPGQEGERWLLRVAKERHGRVGAPIAVRAAG